ncbi:MAG: GNAT family N-acetyltransferase [Desulfobacteraceae bacterium]|jgi:ribosomal-protein-alanine N-acetyltransferase
MVTAPIKTRRLVLKRQSLNDFDRFFDMSKDHDVMKYIGDGSVFHWTRDVAYKKFNEQVSVPVTEGIGVMAIYRESDSRYLGWCAISHSKFLDDMELGYRLCRDCWGCGYATEAASAMLSEAYHATDVNRIMACAHPENTASIRVLEKLGFKFAYPIFSNPIQREIPVYRISRRIYCMGLGMGLGMGLISGPNCRGDF